MSAKKNNRQLITIVLVMLISGTLVVTNVLFTMFTQKHFWSGHSAMDSRIASSIVDTSISATRGTIYDRNHTVIAQQAQAYTVVAYLDKTTVDSKGNPNYVKDAKKTAKSLKKVLTDIDVDNVIKIIKSAKKAGSSQTELGTGTKRLTKKQMKAIKKLDIQGIGFIDAIDRYYPVTPYASNLIGFATYDEDEQQIEGKLGLELSLNEFLKGKDGRVVYQQTKNGSKLPGTTTVYEEAEDGDDVYLTIDSGLQATVEEQLAKTMEDKNTKSAWCVVMEVETGKVLAWSSYPSYDQNEHKQIDVFTDPISESAYEPGSVMKPFTYAAVIDSGNYPYNQSYTAYQFWYTYDESTGKITRVPAGTQTPYPYIADALGENFGTITFDEGLAYSSNVAICELLTNYMNYDQYNSYLDAFGFFQEVDTPYLNQVTGTKNIDAVSDYLSTGFGQASSITILQLCQAYTAIFNDGTMVRPYVVDKIINPNTQKTVKNYKTKAVGTPISESTAKEIQSLMSHVTDDGASGSRFKIEGIDVLMKTGTGQIYNTETGQYDSTYYTFSVMAAAPVDDPKVMVYYGLVGSNITGYSVEPYQTIMKEALKTYGILSSNNSESSEDAGQAWESYTMPSLVNHSLVYANEQLSGKNVNVVTIGNGTQVTDQYPEKETLINSNDRVFILTDGETITMPNMTGWTRKDLTVFWQLTGIQIQTSGYGKVTSQNIEEGTTLSSDSKIEVVLE